MKRFIKVFFIAILVAGFIACIAVARWLRHHNYIMDGDDISLQVRESGDKYQIYASYDRSKTHRVQQYLNNQLHTHIFRNSHIKANMTLEDDTRIYVKNTPGRLVIKLNRDENSPEAYRRLKEIAKGLEVQITH